MICPQCNSIVSDGAQACPFCGTGLTQGGWNSPASYPSLGDACPYCGSLLAQGATFCVNCGNPIGGQANAYPDYPSPAPAAAAPSASASHTPREVVLHSLCGSPLSLIAAVVFTLGTFVFFVGSIMMGSRTLDLLTLLPSEVYYAIRPYVDEISTSALFLLFFSMVPGFLTVGGMWGIFIGAKTGNSKGIAGGLTAAKVGTVFSLVFFCIRMVIYTISMIGVATGLTAFSSYSYRRHEMDSVLMAVFMLFFCIVGLGVLGILYYAKSLGTINAIRRCAVEKKFYEGVSPFAAVILFLLAIGEFILMVYLSSASTLFRGGSGMFCLVFSLFLLAVAKLLLGIGIFLYNSTMRRYTGH